MMEVEVRDSLENAIRQLKKAMERDGIFREIKMRELSPNRTDRRKAKEIVAARRRRAQERKKEKREYGLHKRFNYSSRSIG